MHGALRSEMSNHISSNASTEARQERRPAVVLLVMDEAIIAIDVEAELEQAGFQLAGPLTTRAEALAWLDRHPAPGACVTSSHLADGACDAVLDRLIARNVPTVLFTALPTSSLAEPYRRLPLVRKPAMPGVVARAVMKVLDVGSPMRSGPAAGEASS
jgi:DNA-binding NtrC family response regulator